MDNLPALADELKKLDISIGSDASQEKLRASLVNYIDDLINNNFEKLLNLLYRVDISETKLKQLLNTSTTTPASEIIADLIIERQLQKIKSREQYRQNKNEDEESW